jgi:putative FmdB family regulatory protein
MPTYDYACPACGTFEAFRSIADRDRPAACPRCSNAAGRVVASAPHATSMDPMTRRLIGERTASEGRYARMRHAASCRCC